MTNKPYKRVDRMNDLLRTIISECLLSEIHHKGLEHATVTSVSVSNDFKFAKVYYRVFMLEMRDQVRLSLIGILPKIQRAVAKEMQTRNSPSIKFLYDDSLDEGAKIEELLSGIDRSSWTEEEE